MNDSARLYLAAALICIGLLFGAVSILGVFRFHFVMNRMHCAAILDTAAMAGILGGLMVAAYSLEYIPKLIAALLVLWVSSPIASHIVGKMEMNTDETVADHIRIEEDSDGSD